MSVPVSRAALPSNMAVLALLSLVAACTQATPTSQVAANVASSATSYSDRLKGLSPEWRDATLMRTINDAGKPCDHISATAYQQSYKGLAMWVAHCRSSGNWAVFIGANGYSQVDQCGQLATSGVPVCKAADIQS